MANSFKDGINHQGWRLRVAKTKATCAAGQREVDVWMVCALTKDPDKGKTQVDSTKIRFYLFRSADSWDYAKDKITAAQVDTSTVCDGLGEHGGEWYTRCFVYWSQYFGGARSFEFYKHYPFDSTLKLPVPLADHPKKQPFPLSYDERDSGTVVPSNGPKLDASIYNNVGELNEVIPNQGTIMVFLFGTRSMTDEELDIVGSDLKEIRNLPSAPDRKLLKAMVVRKVRLGEYGYLVLNDIRYIEWEKNLLDNNRIHDEIMADIAELQKRYDEFQRLLRRSL